MVEVTQLSPVDIVRFKQLILLFGDVFETDNVVYSNERLADLLNNKHFVAIVALAHNVVVGGLTGYIMPMYNKPADELYLYDMAVATQAQRQGIGRQLIEKLKEFCCQHNIGNISVEAHAEDLSAVAFYHSWGGAPEDVVHFNFSIQ